MKQRTGFVSNSSASSFLIFGVKLLKEVITDDFKRAFIRAVGSPDKIQDLDQLADRGDLAEYEKSEKLDDTFADIGITKNLFWNNYDTGDYIVRKNR